MTTALVVPSGSVATRRPFFEAMRPELSSFQTPKTEPEVPLLLRGRHSGLRKRDEVVE
jgi:hypothetical protein